MRLLAPSLIVVTLVACLAAVTVSTLGAVRAYVAGESQWSKARSDAVQHLLLYAETGDARQLASFESSLAVPLGDRRAREALMQPEFDRDFVREQLIIGGNHPDDVDGMITLFRRFGQSGLFEDALAAWIRGDQLIGQLQELASRLDEQVQARPHGPQVRQSVQAIRAISQELIDNERLFSASLGHASRWTEAALIASVLASALALSLATVALTRRTLRAQTAHAQALSTINDRWELAASAAQVGLYEFDLSSDTVHLDAKAAELYGLGHQAMVSSRSALLAGLHEDDRDEARARVDAAVQANQVFKLRYRIGSPAEGRRVLENTGRLNIDPMTSLHRVVGVVRDVTDEVNQAHLSLQRDAAEKVAQSQREFLSRLSHELRTPLNAILGFAQLILMDPARALDPIQTRRVNLVLTAGRQLLTLVEDVLDLSKVEAGEIAIVPQDVELVQILRACTTLVDSARERLDITIIDKLPPAPLWARADPHRVQQVLINLLTNACKYNRQGGHVTLEARTDGHEAVIDIIDNGIGLSPDDLAELFQPFRRFGQPAQVEGTGLGLYIVKQLVERMDGSVAASSDKGLGSCFTVRLPLAAR